MNKLLFIFQLIIIVFEPWGQEFTYLEIFIL